MRRTLTERTGQLTFTHVETGVVGELSRHSEPVANGTLLRGDTPRDS